MSTIETNAPCELPANSTARCQTCDRVCYFSKNDEEWRADDTDEYLPDAGDETPTKDFVCSKVCRLQLMYQAGDEPDQAALRKVELAMRVLDEYGRDVARKLEEWLPDETDMKDEVKELVDRFTDLTSHKVGHSRYSYGLARPAWIEQNVAPEETLGRAVRTSLWKLDHAMMNTRATLTTDLNLIRDTVHPRRASEFEARWNGQTLAKIGNVILALKEALEEAGEA